MRIENESEHGFTLKPARKPPDRAACRVSPSGRGNLLYCLAPEPDRCHYAYRAGVKMFCMYPEPPELINRPA